MKTPMTWASSRLVRMLFSLMSLASKNDSEPSCKNLTLTMKPRGSCSTSFQLSLEAWLLLGATAS